MSTVRAAGGHVTTRATETLEPFELAEIASSLGRSGVERLVPAGDRRRWTYAVRTARFEAIVIAWPPGSGLRMHDHDGSLAAVHVIAGRLRERYVDGVRVHTRWLEPGCTENLPATHTHEVINLDEREVVSVHVYSPPLADDSFRFDKEIDITRRHPDRGLSR
jgi:uncharacterized RmlC-like cupin family protein